MEYTRKKLLLVFCIIVFMTGLFLLTSVNKLPRDILPESLQRGLQNFTLFKGGNSPLDSWRYVVRGGSGNKYTPPKIKGQNAIKTPENKAGNNVGDDEPPSKTYTRLEIIGNDPPKMPKDRYSDSGSRTVRTVVPVSYMSTSSTKLKTTALSSPELVKSTVGITSEVKPTKRFPDAIIIGVKKGGTRALLQFLSIHPYINSVRKEMHFFDKRTNFRKGLDWYREQMPLAFPNQTVIEKTPAYFVTPEAPMRILKMNPSVKLIITFRDPTRRSISDYAQSQDKARTKYKASHIKPFEHRLFIDKKKTVVNKEIPKIRIGMYAQHLQRWLDVFPRSQLCFVSGENLVKKPWDELHVVQKFLKIPLNITKDNFFYNKTKGFYCLLWKRGKNGRQKNKACLNEAKGRKHPFVSARTIKTLQDFFRPLNQKLYKMTGRDFEWP